MGTARAYGEVIERFEVGMGCTVCIGSDRYPVTVREVSASGHRIVVSRDRVRGPGIFVPAEEEGRREVFTRRKDGWYRKAGSKSGWYLSTRPGREHYSDPSF